MVRVMLISEASESAMIRCGCAALASGTMRTLACCPFGMACPSLDRTRTQQTAKEMSTSGLLFEADHAAMVVEERALQCVLLHRAIETLLCAC